MGNILKVSYILLFVLLIPIVLAETTYHKQSMDLNFSITSNNATNCNLTKINSPTGIIVINQIGTRNSQTFNFSINKGNYSQIGVYCHNIECYDGVKFVSGEKCFNVNYFGKELSSSQSTLYLGLLAILIFILFVTFFGMGFLPASNQKDETGRILSITYLKYLRLPMWLFAYFLFVGVIYLSSNIAFAFLSEQLFGKLIFAVFSILMAISPIIVIVLVISFFVQFFHDRELQQYFDRGIFPGENL